MPRLRLVSSPVLKGDGFSLAESSEENGVERKPKLQVENTISGLVSGHVDNSNSMPQFVKHEESTNIELFYDLFFVANLTSFSDVHEVNSAKSMKSYIGFFCILWFTWCQTSLFDIRFVADSWLERIAKAIHLGVMVGLAVVGPNYSTEVGVKDPSPEDLIALDALKTMAIILAVSRFILGLQYLLIGFHIRDYKNTKLPLGLMAIGMEVAALIYLILAFLMKTHEHTYRAFYVIAAYEMIMNIGLSWHWKVLGFKRTHLVERMSLLTLYILGEGVIDALKSVSKLVEVNSQWTAATIGLMVAGISVIYMLYMLYFDCLNHKHFGSLRQQLWAFAHFPFHVALVLALAGLAQFVKWYQVITVIEPWLEKFEGIFFSAIGNTTVATGMVPISNATLAELVTTLNETIATLFEAFEPEYTATYDEWTTGIYNLSLGYTDDLNSRNEFLNSGSDLMATVMNSIFNTYGFEPAESDSSAPVTAAQELEADFGTIDTVFIYFFVAAGMTLVIMGFLSLIMDTHRRWGFGTVFRFASHVVVGLAVALLALLDYSDTVGLKFATSAWVLPTFTIAVAILLGVHHIKWGPRDHEVDEIDHMAERADTEHNTRHGSSS